MYQNLDANVCNMCALQGVVRDLSLQNWSIKYNHKCNSSDICINTITSKVVLCIFLYVNQLQSSAHLLPSLVSSHQIMAIIKSTSKNRSLIWLLRAQYKWPHFFSEEGFKFIFLNEYILALMSCDVSACHSEWVSWQGGKRVDVYEFYIDNFIMRFWYLVNRLWLWQ